MHVSESCTESCKRVWPNHILEHVHSLCFITNNGQLVCASGETRSSEKGRRIEIHAIVILNRNKLPVNPGKKFREFWVRVKSLLRADEMCVCQGISSYSDPSSNLPLLCSCPCPYPARLLTPQSMKKVFSGDAAVLWWSRDTHFNNSINSEPLEMEFLRFFCSSVRGCPVLHDDDDDRGYVVAGAGVSQ